MILRTFDAWPKSCYSRSSCSERTITRGIPGKPFRSDAVLGMPGMPFALLIDNILSDLAGQAIKHVICG